MDQIETDHPRFVTIDYFVKDMLGYKHRVSYYDHLNDPGWPQRVYPGGKPMLVYDECVAYQRQIMADRGMRLRESRGVLTARAGRVRTAPVP